MVFPIVMAQTVKWLSIMRETWVWSLGLEDPLEKEMAIHSYTIAWKIPWTEEPGSLQSMRSQRVRQDWATSLSLSLWCMDVEMDYKESWVLKNWCFWIVVLEKTLESPLDCMEIQPVHSKGNEYWIFTGRTDAETETPILWPPDMKNWFIWKHPHAGKDWRREEKGMTKDEMARWHHRSIHMSLGELLELVMDREAWCAAIHVVAKSRTRLSDWTELNWRPWLGFPRGSDGKASVCNMRDLGLILGLGRSSRGGNGNPLQYPCLENPMDRGI